VITDGAVIYNQALYLGVANLKTGFQLWRTTVDLSRGSKVVDWQQVEIDEPNHYQNAYVVLVQFNGSLYAWTTNYFTGQQVLRTHCPVCQQINIQGSGRYQAGVLGVRVDLERTSARSMEVCSYPDSFYLTRLEGRPIKHYYMIKTDPLVSSSSGELSLTYSEAEMAASTITNPQSAVLLRWQGQTWETCQADVTDRVPEENNVSCSHWDDLNQLWTIGGPGVTPIK
jgi:hypothetical protein